MAFLLQKEFHNNGYLVLNNFLCNEECNEIQKEAATIAEKQIQDEAVRVLLSKKHDSHLLMNYFLESYDKIRIFYEDGALDEKGKLLVPPEVAVNKIAHALHSQDPIFRCYTYCRRTKLLCQKLGLVDPAVVQSMFLFKNPGCSSVSPHQDATFIYSKPLPPLGFWIALEDATVANGCLFIAKGSHKWGLHRRLIKNPDQNSKSKLIYDRPAPIYPDSMFTPVPLNKGSCIVLHGNVIHKSGMNKTDKSHPYYAFHVIEKENNSYSPDNWLQEGPTAPFDGIYYTRQIMSNPLSFT